MEACASSRGAVPIFHDVKCDLPGIVLGISEYVMKTSLITHSTAIIGGYTVFIHSLSTPVTIVYGLNFHETNDNTSTDVTAHRQMN